MGSVVPFPYGNIPRPILFLNGFLQEIIGIAVIGIAILFYLKYREKRTAPLKYLTLTFFTFGLGIFVGGIAPVLSWIYYDSASPDPLVYGLPIPLTNFFPIEKLQSAPFYGFLRWPFNGIGYQIAMLSNIFMMQFLYSIFRKPEKKIVTAYTIICILWMIGTSFYTIFIYGLALEFPQTGSSVSPVGAALLLVIGGFVYSLLGIYSHSAAKKEQDALVRTGFRLIEAAAIATLLSYLIFVTNTVLSLNLDFVAWLMGFITVALIYLGFVMPEWLRNWLKKRYNIT